MRILNPDNQNPPPKSAGSTSLKKNTVSRQIISGLVTRIVDGNSFELSVHVEDGDNHIEKFIEKIRIHGMDNPSTSTLSGILAKLELEKKIIGRKVECEVLERDQSNQILAVLPKRFLLSSLSFDPDFDC